MLPQRVLSCLLIPMTASLATAAEPVRNVSVTGQGTATAPPDMAMFDVAVVSQAATAAEALAANNEAVNRMIEVLKAAQIADKDLQTSRFDISPIYKNTRDGRDPKITGYQVTNQVHVVVRTCRRWAKCWTRSCRRAAIRSTASASTSTTRSVS